MLLYHARNPTHGSRTRPTEARLLSAGRAGKPAEPVARAAGPEHQAGGQRGVPAARAAHGEPRGRPVEPLARTDGPLGHPSHPGRLHAGP